MATEPHKVNRSISPTSRPAYHYDDPLVIGVGALALGYIIGSGRWNWLGQTAGKLAGSLGTLALNCLSQSVQKHNPQFFQHTLRNKATATGLS